MAAPPESAEGAEREAAIPPAEESETPLASATPSAPAAPQDEAPAAHVPEFLPLRDAAVGEGVRYVDHNGGTSHYEIEKVDASEVTTRVIVLDRNGQPLGQPATRRDRRDADLLALQATRTQAGRSARPEQIEAMGRRWDAVVYEDRWVDEEIHYVRRSWVSSDVPVFGLIRMELTGDGQVEATLELRDMRSKAR